MPVELQVANCPICGTVFQKNLRNLCLPCARKLDDALNRCVDALRRNRRMNIQQLSDTTGVGIATITQFIRENKILLHELPNLHYHCELCRAPIRTGKLCVSCTSGINNDIHKMREAERAAQEKLQKETQMSYKISDRLGRR